MTNYRDELKAPFGEKHIEWRVQQSGFTKDGKPWVMVLAYVTARAVMDRLDDVFGVHGWSDKYEHRDGGVLCKLSCSFNNNWICKEDGSPETAVEAFKGGISKALVRAAVKFGVGRYLYDLDVNFADCSVDKKNGWMKGYCSKTKKAFFWKPPVLPKWALPEPVKQACNDTKKKYFLRMKEYYGEEIPQANLTEAKIMSEKDMQEAIAEIELEILDKDYQ